MRRAAHFFLLLTAITLLGAVAGVCWWRPDADAQSPQPVAPSLQADPDAVVFLLTNELDRPVYLYILADDTLPNLLGSVAAHQRGIFVVPSSSLAQVRTVRGLAQPDGQKLMWPTTLATRIAGRLVLFTLVVPPPGFVESGAPIPS